MDQGRVKSDSRVDGGADSTDALRDILALSVMLAVMLIMWARHDRYQPAKWMTPEAAVDAIQSQNLKGNGLHHLNYGAYLIFRGIPVFMDARIDLYKDAGMNRYMQIEKASDPNILTREFDRWDIQWTLFPKHSQINLLLRANPLWEKIHEDDQSVVFSRVN